MLREQLHKCCYTLELYFALIVFLDTLLAAQVFLSQSDTWMLRIRISSHALSPEFRKIRSGAYHRFFLTFISQLSILL